MHVFVTGATGWVGSEVVKDLINAGYLVTGLARSDDKARALAATGAKVLRGSLDDLDTLRRAAWPAKPACRRISGRGRTAGRGCTAPMRRECIAGCWTMV